MKKSTKVKILGAFACLFGVAILTGCAQNFCEDIDKAYIAYPYEQGVTVYCNKEDIPDAAAVPFRGHAKGRGVLRA